MENESVVGDTVEKKCEEIETLQKEESDSQSKDEQNIGTAASKPVQSSGDQLALDSNEQDEIPAEESETVKFKVVFNKVKHDITWPLDKTVLSLKDHIQTLTKVAPTMQKLMFKGLAKDDKSLRELGVTNGSKMMLVGSKLQDVISVNTVDSGASSSSSKEKSESNKESVSKQKQHLKVIEKGVPDDAIAGYSNCKEVLPSTPLRGMINKYSNKVRLTFKLESDQLWLGTKDRTEKLPLSSIKDIVSEKIEGHPGYHMIALQLGPTEQSRYWIYWVPSQYVDAIKDAILGKWQMF